MCSSLSPEERVPTAHPLRTMRALAAAVLQARSRQFDALSSPTGRPSMAPAKVLRALRRHVRYTLRRERLRRAPRDDNRWCRWFVGLNRDDAVGEPTVCRTNRERLRAGEGAKAVCDPGLA
jgi:hypothetical protein